jgi:hypothetical protein
MEAISSELEKKPSHSLTLALVKVEKVIVDLRFRSDFMLVQIVAVLAPALCLVACIVIYLTFYAASCVPRRGR